MSHTTELFMGMRSLFRLYDKMLKRVCTEYDLTVIEGDIISFCRIIRAKIQQLIS